MIPTLFLAHGSPMLAIESNEYAHFLANVGKRFKPDAIVVFTAHWESDVPAISFTDDEYETIYDFGGFPDELYAVKYPAKGSKRIASMVKERFESQGIAAKTNAQRGLDHGSWVILSHLYPKADIPVVQISVNPYLSPAEQFKIGRSLQGIGKDRILVIGSGGTVHNLRSLKWDQTTPEPWAVQFDDWLIDKIQNADLDALFQYEKLAPHARLAVPRAEHFVPLFIAMGSGEPQKRANVLYRSYDYGTLSYLCFEF